MPRFCRIFVTVCFFGESCASGTFLPRAEVPTFLSENRDPLSIRCQLVLEMVAQPPFEFGVKAGA